MQRTNDLPAITLGAADFSRLDQLASVAEYKLPDVASFLGKELERARVVPAREVDADVVAGWAADDRDDLVALGLDADVVLATVREAADELAAQWRPLVHRFAALAGALVPASQEVAR